MSASPYASKLAASIEPYVPGEQPKAQNLIKLNTNENAYPPSPKALEAMREEMPRLHLYSDPQAAVFVQAVAEREGLPKTSVFPGNGSDEVLAFSYLAFFDRDAEVLAPEISYSFYPVYADLFGMRLKKIPMREGLSIDVADYMLDSSVILANPNAPTGRALPLEDIERLCAHLRKKGKLLLVDEAYVEFGAESAARLIGAYDNLLVVRTMSKSHALAGLRLGYALGQPPLIEALNAIKNSFNSYTLDRLAIVGGAAALLDEEYFREKRDAIVATRERFVEALSAQDFEVLPSKANFVFARHKALPGKELFDRLRERNILVRHFGAPQIADYLRISIGTDEAMQALLHQMEEIRGK